MQKWGVSLLCVLLIVLQAQHSQLTGGSVIGASLKANAPETPEPSTPEAGSHAVLVDPARGTERPHAVPASLQSVFRAPSPTPIVDFSRYHDPEVRLTFYGALDGVQPFLDASTLAPSADNPAMLVHLGHEQQGSLIARTVLREGDIDGGQVLALCTRGEEDLFLGGDFSSVQNRSTPLFAQLRRSGPSTFTVALPEGPEDAFPAISGAIWALDASGHKVLRAGGVNDLTGTGFVYEKREYPNGDRVLPISPPVPTDRGWRLVLQTDGDVRGVTSLLEGAFLAWGTFSRITSQHRRPPPRSIRELRGFAYPIPIDEMTMTPSPVVGTPQDAVCPPRRAAFVRFPAATEAQITVRFEHPARLSGVWLKNPKTGPHGVAVFRVVALPSMTRLRLRSTGEPEGCETCELLPNGVGVFEVAETHRPLLSEGVRIELVQWSAMALLALPSTVASCQEHLVAQGATTSPNAFHLAPQHTVGGLARRHAVYHTYSSENDTTPFIFMLPRSVIPGQYTISMHLPSCIENDSCALRGDVQVQINRPDVPLPRRERRRRVAAPAGKEEEEEEEEEEEDDMETPFDATMSDQPSADLIEQGVTSDLGSADLIEQGVTSDLGSRRIFSQRHQEPSGGGKMVVIYKGYLSPGCQIELSKAPSVAERQRTAAAAAEAGSPPSSSSHYHHPVGLGGQLIVDYLQLSPMLPPPPPPHHEVVGGGAASAVDDTAHRRGSIALVDGHGDAAIIDDGSLVEGTLLLAYSTGDDPERDMLVVARKHSSPASRDRRNATSIDASAIDAEESDLLSRRLAEDTERVTLYCYRAMAPTYESGGWRRDQHRSVDAASRYGPLEVLGTLQSRGGGVGGTDGVDVRDILFLPALQLLIVVGRFDRVRGTGTGGGGGAGRRDASQAACSIAVIRLRSSSSSERGRPTAQWASQPCSLPFARDQNRTIGANGASMVYQSVLVTREDGRPLAVTSTPRQVRGAASGGASSVPHLDAEGLAEHELWLQLATENDGIYRRRLSSFTASPAAGETLTSALRPLSANTSVPTTAAAAAQGERVVHYEQEASLLMRDGGKAGGALLLGRFTTPVAPSIAIGMLSVTSQHATTTSQKAHRHRTPDGTGADQQRMLLDRAGLHARLSTHLTPREQVAALVAASPSPDDAASGALSGPFANTAGQCVVPAFRVVAAAQAHLDGQDHVFGLLAPLAPPLPGRMEDPIQRRGGKNVSSLAAAKTHLLAPALSIHTWFPDRAAFGSASPHLSGEGLPAPETVEVFLHTDHRGFPFAVGGRFRALLMLFTTGDRRWIDVGMAVHPGGVITLLESVDARTLLVAGAFHFVDETCLHLCLFDIETWRWHDPRFGVSALVRDRWRGIRHVASLTLVPSDIPSKKASPSALAQHESGGKGWIVATDIGMMVLSVPVALRPKHKEALLYAQMLRLQALPTDVAPPGPVLATTASLPERVGVADPNRDRQTDGRTAATERLWAVLFVAGRHASDGTPFVLSYRLMVVGEDPNGRGGGGEHFAMRLQEDLSHNLVQQAAPSRITGLTVWPSRGLLSSLSKAATTTTTGPIKRTGAISAEDFGYAILLHGQFSIRLRAPGATEDAPHNPFSLAAARANRSLASSSSSSSSPGGADAVGTTIDQPVSAAVFERRWTGRHGAAQVTQWQPYLLSTGDPTRSYIKGVFVGRRRLVQVPRAALERWHIIVGAIGAIALLGLLAALVLYLYKRRAYRRLLAAKKMSTEKASAATPTVSAHRVSSSNHAGATRKHGALTASTSIYAPSFISERQRRQTPSLVSSYTGQQASQRYRLATSTPVHTASSSSFSTTSATTSTGASAAVAAVASATAALSSAGKGTFAGKMAKATTQPTRLTKSHPHRQRVALLHGSTRQTDASTHADRRQQAPSAFSTSSVGHRATSSSMQQQQQQHLLISAPQVANDAHFLVRHPSQMRDSLYNEEDRAVPSPPRASATDAEVDGRLHGALDLQVHLPPHLTSASGVQPPRRRPFQPASSALASAASQPSSTSAVHESSLFLPGSSSAPLAPEAAMTRRRPNPFPLRQQVLPTPSLAAAEAGATTPHALCTVLESPDETSFRSARQKHASGGDDQMKKGHSDAILVDPNTSKKQKGKKKSTKAGKSKRRKTEKENTVCSGRPEPHARLPHDHSLPLARERRRMASNTGSSLLQDDASDISRQFSHVDEQILRLQEMLRPDPLPALLPAIDPPSSSAAMTSERRHRGDRTQAPTTIITTTTTESPPIESKEKLQYTRSSYLRRSNSAPQRPASPSSSVSSRSEASNASFDRIREMQPLPTSTTLDFSDTSSTTTQHEGEAAHDDDGNGDDDFFVANALPSTDVSNLDDDVEAEPVWILPPVKRFLPMSPVVRTVPPFIAPHH